MKHSLLLATAVLTLLTASFARADSWKEVDEAIRLGLPRTAIEALEPIIENAVAEGRHDLAVKAIARKIVLEGSIEGNLPEERIVRLEAVLPTATDEMQPILHAVLAHWYWHYFQQNRWRFMQRTLTAEPPGDDFTTWDLPRLFTEIDRQFKNALVAEEFLKNTPVAAWDGLLEKGTLPDQYRPTLFDFIAHEALSFYTSEAQAGSKPQDDFEITADSPIFGSVDEFLAWDLPPETTESLKARAVSLYQELLRFHGDDEDRFAFADIDLARLVFGRNSAVGSEREDRFIEAVSRFVNEQSKHEVAAMGLFQWAQSLHQQENRARAHEVASLAVSNYQDSPGARLAQNLIFDIEAKSASISTERVWNAPWPDVEVTYRNINRVFFRAVALDWKQFLRDENSPDRPSRERRRDLVNAQPTASWENDLPPTADFKEGTKLVGVVQSLQPGFYAILASHDPDFHDADNQLSVAIVWISDLAMVQWARPDGSDGLVVEARSGEPIAGATVELWGIPHQQRPERLQQRITTDVNGFFSFDSTSRSGRSVARVVHNGHELTSTSAYHYGFRHDTEQSEYAAIFTDRVIYRPGQTIEYKGILLRTDPASNNYETISGRRVSVVFYDANGQIIEQQNRQANDFGSFSGSFTAPQDRLTGQMRIEVAHHQNAAFVRVEEYKRPRFRVTLNPPKEAPRIHETVTVTGQADSYTRAAIDGAEARYRVVREVRWPWWWRSRFSSPRGAASQEIAHGTLRTGVDGSFELSFIAHPDASISEEDEPIFVYRVHIDVTDHAGETRSAHTRVSVGYTALEATLSLNSWQTTEQPVEIEVKTLSLDGEVEPAEGLVTIYKLKAPEQVYRRPIQQDHGHYGPQGGPSENGDLSDPNSWPLGEVIAATEFSTGKKKSIKLEFSLPGGIYRAVIETQDRFGKPISGEHLIHVLDPIRESFEVRVPHHFAIEKESFEPGETFRAFWGTGYDTGRAFVEITHRNQVVQTFWTAPERTQALIEVEVTEEMRGGFSLNLTFVHENRAYTESHRVGVPWSNKKLEIRWEHFTSKLEPNQKETWTAVITGPDAKPAAAEMVASLYDASLDSFVLNYWTQQLHGFYQERNPRSPRFLNHQVRFDVIHRHWERPARHPHPAYRSFPPDLIQHDGRYQRPMALRAALQSHARTERGLAQMGDMVGFEAAPAMEMAMAVGGKAEAQAEAYASDEEAAELPDLLQVSARRNLQETAFFFPQLISDEDGVVRMTFTMPEALTEWRFLSFAHDQQMRSGFIEGSTVTSKELMVQPNSPRFVREGDTIEFTVLITNQSDSRQHGNVSLSFTDAMTGEAADDALSNLSPEIPFDVPAQESRSYAWRLQIPDGLAILTYRTVAASATVSDGEEGYLPVLSQRVLVREALPLPIRGPDEKEFAFEKLLRSEDSDTLQHQSLTVQMVSNPAWYAVMALPYLMEFPYECTEQTFNRLYANTLARHIANSNPAIRRTFDLWKNTPAFDSPLNKNEELKNVVLQETPWVRQAQSESQSRREIGILFDENRLNHQTDQTLRKLIESQMSDGAWPWFPGGRANDFITLYITTGFGRMRHLGAEIPMESPLRSLNRLDNWIHQRYQDIDHKELNHLTPIIAHYLYGRSFFLEDQPVASAHQEAVDYFLNQARTYWVQLNHRLSQGHLAIALLRFGDAETPTGIMNSLRERAVNDEEMGMFWRDQEYSWWWYRAPIETQALMIEAFAEVADDKKAVENCKVWLLKQKQTQDWKTTKATADAVYALLLRGANLLASSELVQVSIGKGENKENLTPQRRAPPDTGRRAPGETMIEPGTGFYEARFSGAEVIPDFGHISVRKIDEGVAWGGIHWSYLEDIAQITPHEATPLKLRKQIFTRTLTDRGPILTPVKGPLTVGDELVVRIELRTDRDMEYVHLKDQRGSGLEPLNVLSGYRYQDGLAYYESTRDTASHFFIDYLPKGVYVFEYSTRIFHRGEYPTGIAEIQSMYAPEFSSHSESIPLVVE